MPPFCSDPKKGGVEDMKDFRPIGLVSRLCKLLAKVFENKLKEVVKKVVSNYEHALMADRQTLDAVLMENEAIDSRMKSNLNNIICKMDIEKTYNHIN